MQTLNFPFYPFKIHEAEGKNYIFDELRKKHLLLTPEEWVRQHFVQYLIHQRSYPKALIKLEGGLRLHTMRRRTDVLVYNLSGQPVLLAECKAPSIPLSQKVFEQASRYNLIHKVPYLVVTNGMQQYCAEINIEEKSYAFLEEIPAYIK